MKAKPVTLRLPEGLVALVALVSREQRTDRSTILRQWLYQSAEEYAIKMVSEGRLSIGRAAELLDLSHFDIYRIAQDKRIELGATEEQYDKGMQHAARLKPRVRS
jgi:predicted HTH domain antitoxin